MTHRYAMSALLALSMISAWANAATTGVLIKSENVYAQPSSTAKVVSTVLKGSSVSVASKQGGWLKIGSGQTQGWVRMLSVRTSGAVVNNTGSDIVGIAQMATGKRQPGQIVATAGVRGLSEEDLKSAHYSEAGIAELATYQASSSAAIGFAKQAKLIKQNVAYLPAPIDAQ